MTSSSTTWTQMKWRWFQRTAAIRSTHKVPDLGVNYTVTGIETPILKSGIGGSILKGIGTGEYVIGIFNNFFNYIMLLVNSNLLKIVNKI